MSEQISEDAVSGNEKAPPSRLNAPGHGLPHLPAYPQGLADFNTRVLGIELLLPHPRNPRKHPAKGTPEYETLVTSLTYDYFDPIVWNVRNGMLVGGHLRAKVLLDMGVTQVRVIVVDYDEPTHIARMMAANKSIGQNDDKVLSELLGELEGMSDFETGLTGFTGKEIADHAAKFDAGSGPDFDFSTTANVPAQSTQGANTDIRYFQLIFGTADYDRFGAIMDRLKVRDALELERKYGTFKNELPNLLLHILECHIERAVQPA